MSQPWPEAPTAKEVLYRIRNESSNNSEKGRWFENLFLRLIRDTPEFDVNAAYRWRDWPDRERLTRLPVDDRGIDLIAVQNDGSIIAIQCKCYDESHTLQKSDIDSFLSASAESAFDERWVVATSSLGRTAKEYINQLEKIPRLVDFSQYGDKPILYHQFKRDGRSPFDLQQKAIDAVINGLSTKDRGQLVMACGTGKTYVSLCAAEGLVRDGGAILFVAPSIALVSQARREWLTHTKRPLSGLVVCSDSGTGGGGDNEDIRVSDLVCKVTTDPSTIATHMKQNSTRVVFCTYQSLDKICDAQVNQEAPEFDVIIADEAHRTTGVETGGWSQTIHDDKKLLSKKRLYMTATQRLYTVQSKRAAIKKGYVVNDMDDYEKFGTVLHRLSFKDAVEAKRLSNYKIIIMCARNDRDVHDLYTLITGDDKEHALNHEDVTRLLGTAMAINGIVYGESGDHIKQLPKVLGFSNSIKRSKAFTALLNLPELHSVVERRARADGISLNAQHMVEHRDGNSGSIERGRSLRDLEDADSNSPRMLCNVKLFTEGVDVPSLDAVAFLDPRDSQVDVVQAVGRVMRKAEGKEYGYIIVPVLLEPGENVVESLASNPDGWKALGQVLRAMQSHDGRLSEDPLQFLLTYDTYPGATDESPTIEGIRDVADFQEVSETFYAKVVGNSGIYKPGEAVADDIKYVVNLTANALLEAGVEDILAEALGLKIGAEEFTGIYVCKIAALLITNACLMHRRLQEHIDELTTLNSVGGLEDPVTALEMAWNHILEKDYAPVFEPALGVVGVLPRGGPVDEAICRMADIANRTADSLSDLGYDHAGPLYHKILDTAKSDSANYTDNISALMLARLVFTDDFVDWSNMDDVTQLRIMDPACGTGTLLMAALKTIKDRMSLGDDIKSGSMHRQLVEYVLCGLDINRHAIQLAACNLTLGAPTIDYSDMHLYTMRHGPQGGGVVKAGSIEILRTTDKNDTMQAFVQPLQSIGDLRGEQVDNTEMVEFPLSGLDCIIMNPPYGSNITRSRKYPPDTVKLMQKNELAIRNELVHRDQKAGDAIDVNSIRTFFTPLADRMLDKKNGTLAMVMPVTACIGASGLKERKLLADRFHVERIITSHDPKHVNFSYKTGIHECLMVCRRYSGDTKPPTKFISLYKMPKNAEEAIEVVDAITDGDMGGWGSVVSWPAERITAGDWSPAQWSDAGLAGEILRLESSPLLESVGRRYEIGPAGQQLRGNTYRACEEWTTGAVKTFWLVSAKLRKTIRGEPESWRKPADAAAKKLWERRSNLLIAAKFNTISGRLTALYSDEPSIGSGWIPVSVKDEWVAKALAVWWNSTPVRMMLLNRRSKMLTYPQWSMVHLREICIPKQDSTGWDALYKAYGKICDSELLPLGKGPEDPVRAVIDDAAAKVLGLNPDVLAGWREMLAREPTISSVRASQ